MKFSNLTFIVTDNCNFNCSYCHQEKQENIISNHTTKRSAEFFYPFLNDTEQNYISFYGGEPLLAFEQITYAVGLINEMNKTGNKKINYTITTNGSLLTGENMDFFERNEFTVVLSFDGLAQEKGREEGTFEQMVLVMKELQARPGIKVEINSVFSPQTIRLLAASMQFIIQQKGPEITFNISTIEEWGAGDMEALKKELEKLSEYLGIYYRGTGDIPVKNFRNSSPGDRPVVYRCSAGREQVTVSPDGDIWGCYLFHDYFKSRKDSRYYREFAFGGLDDFIGNH
ncbi:MAG: radical SAM protein, partial [bacterium]|nr:radical SAM protein [bacterium]